VHEHQRTRIEAVPSGPFGYRACHACGVAVQRRVMADGHECDPDRYAAHQSSKLHWKRAGFDDALREWLQTPAGRFAEFYARRLVRPPAPRPGEA
jgi:hypothetical protein